MPLRPEAVPAAVRPLLGLAAAWGIGDDDDRERKVDSADRGELQALVDAVDSAPDDLWNWLIGPESYSPQPAPEYIAITCLTMAADSAPSEACAHIAAALCTGAALTDLGVTTRTLSSSRAPAT